MTVPAAPIILVTTGHPTLHQHPGPDGEAVHPRLGRLLQPRHLSSAALTAAAGIPWAADNDCFQGLDEVAYVKMLDRLEGLEGCLFVTVPDVVGDSIATRASFDRWAPELERRAMPLGYVAQDGMTLDELADLAPRLAALFLGGSTEWKEGPEAAELARAAKRAGLWVHWGRVNTRRRFDLIVATGAADSFDGSKWARFRKTYLDGGLAWLDEAADNRRRAIAAGALDPQEDHPMTQMTHGQAADALDRMREESRLEAEALIALEAELWLLERFDMLRRVKLDDYGKGQRHRELARLRNDLERRGGRRYFAGTRDELRTLNADDVAAAWDRIARPRIARLRRETYRSSTRPTRMTLAAWADLQRELEADRAHRAADARGVAQAVARTLRGES